MPQISASDKFREHVGLKFQLYNSLFLSLPFYGVDKTGIYLSLFNEQCESGYADGKGPIQIVEDFFAKHSENDKIGLLFRFVQYVERQVVLFDALEDAAFTKLNDMNGAGTVKHLLSAAGQQDRNDELAARLESFSARLVLTAHPTQFYPGSVLGIINDLVDAISVNNVNGIDRLLRQLGRTPFFNKERPTPFDEASSQIWFLENVFYDAVGHIIFELKSSLKEHNLDLSKLVKIGFWSGGDRDGNPYVTAETTLQVADALRRAVLRCYYNEVRLLKRRLTFAGVESALNELNELLYNEAFANGTPLLTQELLLNKLNSIRNLLYKDHNALFIELLDDLIYKAEVFGLHFAALDIRQESSEHTAFINGLAQKGIGGLPHDYESHTPYEKIDLLTKVRPLTPMETKGLGAETLRTIDAIKKIHQQNGTAACERYIISQTNSSLNIIEVYALFLLGGWKKEEIKIDIVPLFETISDLKNAKETMLELFDLPAYRDHLKLRGNRQTIMLGFSDGTKDGGYLMANWSIFKAKDELADLGKEYGIDIIFFDGRGGPTARGGGKTHRFYSSMSDDLVGDAIELTIQGQTISSNFGTVDSARFNIEQLLHSGIYTGIFTPRNQTFTPDEEDLMKRLSDESFNAYKTLKNDPEFLEYLSAVSPLSFYSQTNIGSRPAKRGTGRLTLKDLRAIPFVGAWTQLKQNVPGFYGFGSAVKKMESDLPAITAMYKRNPFFKTLVDNCEMTMQKSFFPLTEYLAEDEKYGRIWKLILKEFDLCRKYLQIITGSTELMGDLPLEKESVMIRERIVLPLITIQQFALAKLRALEDSEENMEAISTYGKLVVRCSFGIINAGRNSA